MTTRMDPFSLSELYARHINFEIRLDIQNGGLVSTSRTVGRNI
jgi:hypothetical protein